uniref:Butyrate response factor 1 n=1 Tax=Rhipicephalus appendiculatus TaxID=34631 RepID=A0A131YCE1_RHIAP
MSAAMVTSFFSDYGANVVYGKNGGNFAASRPQPMLESRRHSTSVAGGGMVAAPPLRRSTSSVAAAPLVLRTTSPKPSPQPQPASRMVPSSNMVSAVGALVGVAAARGDHRKLDRSYSEPVDRSRPSLAGGPPTSPTCAATTPTSPPSSVAQNSSRYKTELCRPFEESGTCKYGDKCQFAHGGHELRTLARHPKYKTELCRTFHTAGFCPYGPRCHFIHNSDESRKSLLTNINPPPPPRPKALSVGSFGSLGSAGDLSPPSSPLYDDPFFAAPSTAFSFSQDFATLVTSPGFGGGSSQVSPFSALSLPESAFPFPAAGAAAQNRVVEGPPSPVDSLGSELDSMSVSAASCGSPLTRLPIFNRLAANGRD